MDTERLSDPDNASLSNEELILSNGYMSVLCLEGDIGLLRRSAKPFVLSLEAGRYFGEAIEVLFQQFEAPRRSIIDMSRAVGRNDEAWEAQTQAAMVSWLQSVERGVVVLKTAAGRLHLQRRFEGLGVNNVRVFDTARQGHAWLMNDRGTQDEA